MTIARPKYRIHADARLIDSDGPDGYTAIADGVETALCENMVRLANLGAQVEATREQEGEPLAAPLVSTLTADALCDLICDYAGWAHGNELIIALDRLFAEGVLSAPAQPSARQQAEMYLATAPAQAVAVIEALLAELPAP